MKKLMLIAATAVMTSAFGANYVYDFSATLKTTKAKFGKVTAKVELGANSTGDMFWYEDPSVTNFLDSVKTVKGIPVPTISDIALATNSAAKAAVIALWESGVYGYKSAGVYCASWKWDIENCYRVAGSKKIVAVLTNDYCCSTAYALTNTTDQITYQETATVIGTPLYQWFGSLDADKATKVEMYAQAVFGTSFKGYLAGQGTRAKKEGQWYISTLSGNIVGTLPAPKCEYCCAKPVPSIAFDCAHGAGAQLPFTAGYGTFRLKINSKKSKFN